MKRYNRFKIIVHLMLVVQISYAHTCHRRSNNDLSTTKIIESPYCLKYRQGDSILINLILKNLPANSIDYSYVVAEGNNKFKPNRGLIKPENITANQKNISVQKYLTSDHFTYYMYIRRRGDSNDSLARTLLCGTMEHSGRGTRTGHPRRYTITIDWGGDVEGPYLQISRQPNKTCYEAGERVRFLCVGYNLNQHVHGRWRQYLGTARVKMPPVSSIPGHEFIYHMDLEEFDDGTRIQCISKKYLQLASDNVTLSKCSTSGCGARGDGPRAAGRLCPCCVSHGVQWRSVAAGGGRGAPADATPCYYDESSPVVYECGNAGSKANTVLLHQRNITTYLGAINMTFTEESHGAALYCVSYVLEQAPSATCAVPAFRRLVANKTVLQYRLHSAGAPGQQPTRDAENDESPKAPNTGGESIVYGSAWCC